MTEPQRIPLLRAVVGSTAYGLATPDSDVDVMEVFAYPTIELLGIVEPPQTVVTTKPDSTAHEAHKFLKLALKANPSITELLWLPDALYEERADAGNRLISIRSALLSRKAVRNAYLGYATQQFRKLHERHGEGFGSVPKNRTEKHARHLARLCEQGYELYATGSMSVVLENPEWFHNFGREVAKEGNLWKASEYLEEMGEKFDACTSVLPEQPDEKLAVQWLRSVRAEYWTPSTSS